MPRMPEGHDDNAELTRTSRIYHREGTTDLVSRNEFLVDEFVTYTAIGKVVGNFAMPLSLWGIALLLAGNPILPDSLSGLRIHGPYLVLTSGLLLSLAFRRGRAFFVLLSLTVAYCAFLFFLERENAGLILRTVYASLCIFVPLNIAIFAFLRERGALNAPGLRRLSLILIEVGAMAAIMLSDAAEFTDVLYRPIFEHALLAGILIPQTGVVCTVVAVTVAVVCAVIRGSVIDAAFATAAASFALACNGLLSPDALVSPGEFVWFCTIAAVIVSVAVVQDSHHMAFYDELTGLPGRRALNQHLASLDGNFTLAMVDIDHFKAFNDTWGHDVGDQVLKLVAARLKRVGGGGTAYRYGGEEFTILFPGRRAFNVTQHVESLRRKIESYKLMLRERGRSRKLKPVGLLSNASGANKWISVTISAGIAERRQRLDMPEVVLAAADKALYRAKSGGRNRVSR
ncbi:MAG: GGDEF domain-containing protein [Prolixibacteraceae bacterium]|nr:GGDEF domain-containing protein [Burkholderiales bacterium]